MVICHNCVSLIKYFFICFGRIEDILSWLGPDLVGVGASCLLLGPLGFNWLFSFAPDFSKLFGAQGSPSSGSFLNMLVLVFDLSWWLSWFVCLSLMIH